MTEQEKYKLIERTCKHDAYMRIYTWATREPISHGSPGWLAKEKAEDHRRFLRNHLYRYDYIHGIVPNDGFYGQRDTLSSEELGDE